VCVCPVCSWKTENRRKEGEGRRGRRERVKWMDDEQTTRMEGTRVREPSMTRGWMIRNRQKTRVPEPLDDLWMMISNGWNEGA